MLFCLRELPARRHRDGGLTTGLRAIGSRNLAGQVAAVPIHSVVLPAAGLRRGSAEAERVECKSRERSTSSNALTSELATKSVGVTYPVPSFQGFQLEAIGLTLQSNGGALAFGDLQLGP
jgi:hypothetical protein